MLKMTRRASSAVGLGLFVFSMWMPGTAAADTVDPLVTFVGGEPALASEVNANFDALKRAVDDNAVDIAAEARDPIAEAALLLGVNPSEIDVPPETILPVSCRGLAQMNMTLEGAPFGTVLAVLGHEAISAPLHYRVAVVASARVGPDPIGAPAVLTITDIQSLIIRGIVTDFRSAGVLREDLLYVVTIGPKLLRARKDSGYETFQELKLSDILTDQFGDAGVPASVPDTTIVYPYEVRWNESRLDFVSRLMERDGLHYHINASDVVVVGSTNASFGNGPTLSYLGHFAPGGRDRIRITSFQKRESAIPEEATVVGYDVLNKASVTASSRAVDGEGEIYTYSSNTNSAQQAKARSLALLGLERAQGLAGRATSNSPGVRAGTLVNVKDTTSAGLSGAYVVTATTHMAYANEDRSCFSYGNAFATIPEAEPFRAPRETPLPRVAGSLPALVSNNVDPDELSRVKVKFYWDNGADQTGESDWARVAQLPGRGDTGFLPDVDDEVLVSFLEGDPLQPIVVGTLWNEVDPPPGSACAALQSGLPQPAEANLAECKLAGIDLAGFDLTDANLDEAGLTGTGLRGAKLIGANLRSVMAIGANLQQADLSNASLAGGANFTAADLFEAKLVNVSGLGVLARAANLASVDASSADLRDADLSGANLADANLAGANLASALLRAANLSAANLTGTNLDGADLAGADLGGVTWSSTTCPDGSNSDDDDGDGFSCFSNI